RGDRRARRRGEGRSDDAPAGARQGRRGDRRSRRRSPGHRHGAIVHRGGTHARHAFGRTTSEDLLMTKATISFSRAEPAVAEVAVLWVTAGLSCDGDSVSITAATQPSLEDVLLGALPSLPKVHLYHPVLATETGEEFLAPFRVAAAGKAPRPFV